MPDCIRDSLEVKTAFARVTGAWRSMLRLISYKNMISYHIRSERKVRTLQLTGPSAWSTLWACDPDAFLYFQYHLTRFIYPFRISTKKSLFSSWLKYKIMRVSCFQIRAFTFTINDCVFLLIRYKYSHNVSNSVK